MTAGTGNKWRARARSRTWSESARDLLEGIGLIVGLIIAGLFLIVWVVEFYVTLWRARPPGGLIRWEDPIHVVIGCAWVLVWLAGAVWYGWWLRRISTGSLPAPTNAWASRRRALAVLVAPGIVVPIAALVVLLVAVLLALILIVGLINLVIAPSDGEGRQTGEQIIKQDGKTYHWDTFLGSYIPQVSRRGS